MARNDVAPAACSSALSWHKGRWVSYLRVSIGRQGRSVSASKRSARLSMTSSTSGMAVKEFVEVESGKKSDR
jgi:hypothetical protein